MINLDEMENRELMDFETIHEKRSDELTELLRQMSGVAVNINQIAKVANASGFVPMDEIAQIKTMQGLLWQAVKEL